MSEGCCITGHRVLVDLDYELMDRVILNLVKNGCKKFFCGMARGFDLAAAESILNIKKDYAVRLVCCVPCPGQKETLSRADKLRYERILGSCDEMIVLSEEYYRGCMHYRDRFMVDNCDVVLCYLRNKIGGTYYTVKYAEKCGKKVIEI